MAADACKPAGFGGHETTAVAPTSQDPSPIAHANRKASNSPSLGRVLPFAQVFVGLITGVLLGAYLAANLLETEYQNIVGDLQSEHHAALLHTRDDYTTCQSNLTLQRTKHDEESNRLMLRADENERAFQQTVERYARERTAAYRDASEGLDAAAARLEDGRARLAAEEAAHETTRLELAQANQSARAAATALAEAGATAAAAEKERRRLERELDAAEEEFERRDTERAECDGHHRDLRECRDTLAGAGENASAAKELARAREELDTLRRRARAFREVEVAWEKAIAEGRARAAEAEGERDTVAAELEGAREEMETLRPRIQSLQEEEAARETEIAESRVRAEGAEGERDAWEKKARSIMAKVAFRHRKEVLDRYGPGPHRLKLTVEDPDAVTEEILLELAPLEIMPHTIRTVLDLAAKDLLAGGTFFLARSHIIVGGPVDNQDAAKNEAMRQRLTAEGYLPDGALLFKEAAGEACAHGPYTIGFNSLGGPDFYVNLKDNGNSHGPRRFAGEALPRDGDPCFARVVAGVDVMERMKAKRVASGKDKLQLKGMYIKDIKVVSDDAS